MHHGSIYIINIQFEIDACMHLHVNTYVYSKCLYLDLYVNLIWMYEVYSVHMYVRVFWRVQI